MKIKGFITHKLAEEYSDCQDYFAVSADERVMAIADGMSQSIFPQWWAKILVDAYIEGWNPMGCEDKIKELQERWMKEVLSFLKEKQQRGEATWMLENCLADKRGAGATFCGIRFTEYGWSGFVLGDSCLIEVNDKNSIIRILRSQDGEFNNHPDYFDSINEGKGTCKQIKGTLQKDCKLLLVSDPFADFLYNKQKSNAEIEYIKELLQIESHEDFCELVNRWRENECLHNDDTTLVIVEFDGNKNISIGNIDSLERLSNGNQANEKGAIDNIGSGEEKELVSVPKDLFSSLISILKHLLRFKARGKSKRKASYQLRGILSKLRSLENG